MKIVNLAARMFDTYGMEDALLEGFKRHHQNFLRMNNKEIDYQNRLLAGGKSIAIGTMRIGDLLKQVIEKHGTPPYKDNPNLVTFLLVHPKNHFVKEKPMAAFFWRNQSSNRIFIAKVVNDVRDPDSNDKDMKYILHHELQHLVRRMYHREVGKEKAEVATPEYYVRQNEMQAFCAGLARTAVKGWANTVEYLLPKWTPEKILEKVSEWRQPKNVYNAFNVFVMNSFMGAFKTFDDNRKGLISSDPELKKKYLYFTFRDFETIMNRYLDELETKARGLRAA